MEVILPSAAVRFAIVHYHIFKNGGSTISALLEREFKSQFVSLHGPCACSILRNDQVSEFFEENRQVAALTSHHLRYPKLQVPGVVVFDWCFLRHPLNRIASLYTYYRGIVTNDPLGAVARNNSGRGFVRELIEYHPNIASNTQVNLLGQGGCFTRPPGSADLEAARAVLTEMAVPGVVECFDEGLIAAEYFLQPAFPSLNLHYVRMNQSRRRSTLGPTNDAANDAEYWDHLWGADFSYQLTKLNQLDLSLHEAAMAEIRRRLRLVPNLAKRTAAFQQRCRALERAA